MMPRMQAFASALPTHIIVPSSRLRGEGCSMVRQQKKGEGDSPRGRCVLRLPLTQSEFAATVSLPSPRKRGEGTAISGCTRENLEAKIIVRQAAATLRAWTGK